MKCILNCYDSTGILIAKYSYCAANLRLAEASAWHKIREFADITTLQLCVEGLGEFVKRVFPLKSHWRKVEDQKTVTKWRGGKLRSRYVMCGRFTKQEIERSKKEFILRLFSVNCETMEFRVDYLKEARALADLIL